MNHISKEIENSLMKYCFLIRVQRQKEQLIYNNIKQQQEEEEEAVGNGVMESPQGLVFISSVTKPDIKDKKKRRKMGDRSTQEEEEDNEEEVMVVTKKPRREEESQLINDLPRQSSNPGTRPKPLSLSRISEIEEKNREILEEYHEFKF